MVLYNERREMRVEVRKAEESIGGTTAEIRSMYGAHWALFEFRHLLPLFSPKKFCYIISVILKFILKKQEYQYLWFKNIGFKIF